MSPSVLLGANQPAAIRYDGAAMGSLHLHRSFVPFVVAALLLGACVKRTGLPSDCATVTVDRAVTLENNAMTPDHIDLCKNQEVTITVSVKQDGELHVHGYEDTVPESEVRVGETHHFSFIAVHAGQFPIELHPSLGDEVQVGILTVYAP